MKLDVKDMAYAAFGAALIAVCSWISVNILPSSVPFTMQTFAVCLVAAVFGRRLGLWTVCCYIALGALGAPVFANFKGGFGALLGTTGGYIIGFVFTALVVGACADRFGRKIHVLAAAMVLGIALCYAFGTAWFVIVYAKNSGPIGVGTALAWCVVPYIVPDIIKIALASLLTGRLYPLYRKGVRYDKG